MIALICCNCNFDLQLPFIIFYSDSETGLQSKQISELKIKCYRSDVYGPFNAVLLWDTESWCTDILQNSPLRSSLFRSSSATYLPPSSMCLLADTGHKNGNMYGDIYVIL